MRLSRRSLGTLGAAVLTLAAAIPAKAEKRDILGSFTDWDAIVVTRDSGERICYMISVPKSTAPEGANRGNVYVTVTHRPKRKVRNEVNVVVGYPFKAGSDATAIIGPGRFTLFTEGQGAWAYTPDDDAKLVAAMRAGSTMTVKGTSARGTATTDGYSLSGFSAAYNAISKACP